MTLPPPTTQGATTYVAVNVISGGGVPPSVGVPQPGSGVPLPNSPQASSPIQVFTNPTPAQTPQNPNVTQQPPAPGQQLEADEFFNRPVNAGGVPQPPKPNDDKSKPDPLEGVLGTEPGNCKYVKKKLLGQGSFGNAWKVEDPVTGTTYAAKIMDTNSMSAKDRGFVTNEVRCLAQCNHPNIIRHVQNLEISGMLVIIMEFADGGDLYKQIKARQPTLKYFKEHEIQFIFLQLCLALDHIHNKKMMHRDLKTANVLLTTTGLVKLGDFGFSRQYEDSLSNPVGSTFCGTPYYLSPELWRRAPYSKKSEMWALGVVLYEVMALKRPFGGRNMDELIDNILHGRRPPLPPQYSADLCNVVGQLLNLDPHARPSLRILFQQQYVRNGLLTLKRSVENHGRISPNIRQEIAASVDDALIPTDAAAEGVIEGSSSKVVPRAGILKRHTADQGWQDCELSLSSKGVTMKDIANGGRHSETIPLHALTSVCPIDPAIANEHFVFAMKNQTGKAFWFKDTNDASFQEWLVALQNAMPF